MSDAALRPDVFIGNLPSLVKQDQATKKGATTEEIQLAAMAESAGWMIFKEFVGQVKDELDQLNEQAIGQGKTKEEIGENAIVISLVKGVVNKLIFKVEDAKDACAK
jgi:hypothetical protein